MDEEIRQIRVQPSEERHMREEADEYARIKQLKREDEHTRAN